MYAHKDWDNLYEKEVGPPLEAYVNVDSSKQHFPKKYEVNLLETEQSSQAK